MRSSKSRSRSKSNRNNRGNVGNVINRVFDSSGPEGKVRGTPQQIIEKYTQLARDAQLANDRVAFENFQQHAEHYLRLLGEAQREVDARREQQEQENRQRQADRDRERAERQDQRGSDEDASNGTGEQPDVIEVDQPEDSGLVETPETAPKKKRTPRPRKPRAAKEDGAPEDSETVEEKPAAE